MTIKTKVYTLYLRLVSKLCEMHLDFLGDRNNVKVVRSRSLEGNNVTCLKCRWQGPDTDIDQKWDALYEAGSIFLDSLKPGEIVPAGLCLTCDSFVYYVER